MHPYYTCGPVTHAACYTSGHVTHAAMLHTLYSLGKRSMKDPWMSHVLSCVSRTPSVIDLSGPQSVNKVSLCVPILLS